MSLAGLDEVARAVRRPVAELSFGGAGAGDWAQATVSVSLEAALAPGVDAVEVVIAAGPGVPSVAPGESGSVALGFADGGAETVFTGTVESVRHDAHGRTRLLATNGGAALARTRVLASYEKQKAGDVVSDLASRAGAGTASVESGLDLAFYVVDDARGAYAHVTALARRCGFLAYVDVEDGLVFAPFVAALPAASFTYGVDVLALEATDATPVLGAVETVGEGAAGSQGADAWSWLVKDPVSVTGSGGAGDPARRVPDASLRSADAANVAARGIATSARLLDVTGRLLVPGAPGARVGSAIALAGAPRDALNGLFLVRSVRHRLSRAEGFTSVIDFSKADGGALGGLL